jgi:ankyrin repeat protein
MTAQYIKMTVLPIPLIEDGAKLRGEYTSLMHSASEGNIELVELLIKDGVDFNASLKNAIHQKDLEVVRVLSNYIYHDSHQYQEIIGLLNNDDSVV